MYWRDNHIAFLNLITFSHASFQITRYFLLFFEILVFWLQIEDFFLVKQETSMASSISPITAAYLSQTTELRNSKELEIFNLSSQNLWNFAQSINLVLYLLYDDFLEYSPLQRPHRLMRSSDHFANYSFRHSFVEQWMKMQE